MKFSLFILATLTTSVLAAAVPAANPEPMDLEMMKRQSVYGCSNSCVKGKRQCWSCNPGGCSYAYPPC
ncbi:hypothetical protein TWF694_004407 [Orbilia ellipsospora]|uniref:Uncharacterized protein n=1 Tax=Orbilia ellipsospora TaxID=2528407 RepID=A0AAV9WXK8_9PEZI